MNENEMKQIKVNVILLQLNREKKAKIHKIMIEINEAYMLTISNGNKYEKK